MNLNSSPSPFHIEQINNDHDHYFLNHQLVSSSSSSSPTSHVIFNSTEDHIGYYGHQLYQPHDREDENYGYHGGSLYEINNKVNSGFKLSIWKKEDEGPAKDSQVKWMSSKIRLSTQSWMKNPDCTAVSKAKKLEDGDDVKVQPSSSLETDDLSSNSSSYNNSNNPIRVCADCNTTKTPLWRSGPKGPKSLCNACGIRQRKARRAMAAAAAAANGTTAVASAAQPPALKIKVQHKEKTGKKGYPSQPKKHCKMAAGSSTSSGQKKLGFEEFLINLNNNLALQCVFPEEEKDAAILLMALSSGLLHG